MAEHGTHIARIGTSGWNYPAPGYGPWTGIFYPLKQGQRNGHEAAWLTRPAKYDHSFIVNEVLVCHRTTVHCVSSTEALMTTVLTQFSLAAPLTRDQAKQVFLNTAPRYRELPGLVRKYYHVSDDGRTSGAVYLWKSRADAERLYTKEWERFVFEQYGVYPSVTFFDCPVIVDNVAETITHD